MTNFEKIKKWSINEFAEFSIKSIAAGIKLCGLEIPKEDLDEMIKWYITWLESEKEENILE